MDSIRVLYVEDDPVDQELTHRHLARHAPHIKLTIAGTVAEALERVTVGDMDVLLAGSRLPDGTALDLLDAVKARGLEVPVVLVTGSGDADVTVRLLKAGATDYLVKRPEYLATLPVVLESACRWFRTASELRRAPIRLLYAEHHPEDMALTLRAFDEHDRRARVETVTRAREALARLKAAHYDVLLLDNRMPDLSGIEVLKELQAEGIRIPVVMVTGEGDEDTAVQAFKQLPSTIENVLAHRRLADEKDGLAVLNDLAKSLVTIKDLDEVLRTRADAAGGRVCLDVEDTGPGISAEIRDRIFEPFFTTKPVGQGTGLGLSLCHGIVEGHGGTLSLVSEPGHGAIFRVELPVVTPPATTGKRAAEAAPVVTGMRILVVDDERLVLQLLGEMLGADHHTVDTVGDGTQALERLRRTSYDLILSDVRMPYLDGPGLYRALERRLPDLCRRFVLMTGDVLSAEVQTFLEQTGVPGLSKPFDRSELRRVIQRVAGAER